MIVYHYCSLETFFSIISNGTLRLSDIAKSNDLLECKALVEKIKCSTLEKLKKHTSDFNNNLIYGVDNDVALTLFNNVFFNKLLNDSEKITLASCFSENGDLLSQWCQYADNGNGVAIGFDTDIINEILTSKEADGFLKFEKIKYMSSINEELADAIESYSNNFFTGLHSIIFGGEINHNSQWLIDDQDFGSYLLRCNSKNLFRDSVFIKNESFQAEQEWRLLLEDEDLDKDNDNWAECFNWDNGNTGLGKLFPKGIQFTRKGDNDVCSYIDLSLKDYYSVITSVVIGPNCKASIDDIFQIMEHFQFSIHLDNITKSKCPYVHR